MSHASEVRRIFKQQRREQEHQAELPYDPQPLVYMPATCPFCKGEGCIMCKDDTRIRAARLPDMTIEQRS